MIKKVKKYLKFIMCCALILSLIAPSYAALSASDGSAFVTKAEFDAALADFNARLTTFEAGINSKIDSQVTSYLDRNGIWNGKAQELLVTSEYVRWDVPEIFGCLRSTRYDGKSWGTYASNKTNTSNYVSSKFAKDDDTNLWRGSYALSPRPDNGAIVTTGYGKSAYYALWDVLVEPNVGEGYNNEICFGVPLFRANKSGMVFINFTQENNDWHYWQMWFGEYGSDLLTFHSDYLAAQDWCDALDLGLVFAVGLEKDESVTTEWFDRNYFQGPNSEIKTRLSLWSHKSSSIGYAGSTNLPSYTYGGNDGGSWYTTIGIQRLNEIKNFFVSNGDVVYMAMNPIKYGCQHLHVGSWGTQNVQAYNESRANSYGDLRFKIKTVSIY